MDARQARGSRATNHEVFNNTTRAWETLIDTKTNRLFVPRFNAKGGDGYATLAGVPTGRRTDTGILDAGVFQSYIDTLTRDAIFNLPLIQKLDSSLYSTRSFIDLPR